MACKTYSVRVTRKVVQVYDTRITVRAPDEECAYDLAQDQAERGEVEWGTPEDGDDILDISDIEEESE